MLVGIALHVALLFGIAATDDLAFSVDPWHSFGLVAGLHEQTREILDEMMHAREAANGLPTTSSAAAGHRALRTIRTIQESDITR